MRMRSAVIKAVKISYLLTDLATEELPDAGSNSISFPTHKLRVQSLVEGGAVWIGSAFCVNRERDVRLI